MSEENRARPTTGEGLPGEEPYERSLRPERFAEYIGQVAHLSNLRIFVEAARRRGEALDHLLLCGPPGLGKTSLAHVVARELGVQIHVTGGPALERKGDLAGLLTNLGPRDVLFIDEVHRLSAGVEENLYPAMEDFALDLIIGEGPGARSLKLPLQRFTLIGATTRAGLLTGPLRDRFGITLRLDPYTAGELSEIALRSARILGVALDPDGAAEIARRSRGTPRIANRLLRRVRDFAELERVGHIDRAFADAALGRLQVDALGMDPMDRRLLLAIIDKFAGGPVGIGTIAAAVGEQPDTVEDVYEPFLVAEGFLARTPRGRVAMPRAYEHLGRPVPKGAQAALL